MQKQRPPTNRQKLSLLRRASYAAVAVGALVLVCALALMLFVDPLMNKFVKPKITEAFAESYPACTIHIDDMNYSVLKNRFGFGGVTLRAVDGTFSITTGSFSVGGISWVHLLLKGKPGLKEFADADLSAQYIELKFPKSQYELHCGALRVSLPDSEIVVESLTLHPSGDDGQFFAGSNIRKTRFHVVVPKAKATGVACLELLQGKKYRTRSVQIHDLFLDVLVDKDKPYAEEGTIPQMPNEILSSMKTSLQVDRLNVVNGSLKYGERMRDGANPAVITFDSIQVLAEGITNHARPGAAIVIHAQGIFMKAGTMKVHMSIPALSPEFSYQYSGSLSPMELNALNGFLEAGEQIRIKRGVLETATFEINVVSGHATGNVHALYRGLKFAVINKYTGSDKGVFNRISSFVANNFKFRGTNVPDKKGSMKIGQVNHTRQRDEYFLEFTWFALRSGVGNIVGF